MESQSKGKISRTQSRSDRGRSTWIWVGIILVAAVAIALFIYRFQGQGRFTLVSGEKELLVLLRNEKVANYRLRYEGRQPVDLNKIKVMLEGQVLHVDVKPVILIGAGQEIQVEPDGSLPSGTSIRLEPNDEFEVRVTYLGQTLGGNYLYGFQIGTTQGARQRTQEITLDHEYEIIVQ